MGLSRKQIAQIVGNDPEAVRAIEGLFKAIDAEIPDEIAAILAQLRDVGISQSASSVVARQAIDAANRLASAIEALQAMPAPRQDTPQAGDNPAPVAFLGASGEIDTSTTVIITVHNGIITEIA